MLLGLTFGPVKHTYVHMYATYIVIWDLGRSRTSPNLGLTMFFLVTCSYLTTRPIQQDIYRPSF